VLTASLHDSELNINDAREYVNFVRPQLELLLYGMDTIALGQELMEKYAGEVSGIEVEYVRRQRYLLKRAIMLARMAYDGLQYGQLVCFALFVEAFVELHTTGIKFPGPESRDMRVRFDRVVRFAISLLVRSDEMHKCLN